MIEACAAKPGALNSHTLAKLLPAVDQIVMFSDTIFTSRDSIH